jgi:hypothetical protein
MHRREASTPSLHGLNGVHTRQVAVALVFRFLFAYHINMPDDEKQRGALLIAACLIAAIRLRGEPIKPSPKLSATIYDSVQLAVLVWRELQSRGSLPKN